jgi:phosphoglycerate dehydrogenase-like enzyme
MLVKVLVADSFAPDHQAAFQRSLGDKYEVCWLDDSSTELDVGQMADTEYIVCYNKDLNKDFLSTALKLKAVVRLGSAKGAVDADYLKSNGITYATTESLSLISVAEHSFMLMLALAKELMRSDRGVREGLNPRNAKEVRTDQFTMAYNWLDLQEFDALYGKTLGIVGYGTVGKRLARMANACDMEVVYYSRSRMTIEEEQMQRVKYLPLDDLLAVSDFVSLHVKLNNESRGLINREKLARMKRTAYLINTSRGAVVNESDLIEALREGNIAGAALDVFEVEPLPANSPLRKMDNVILTAHSAGIPLHRSLFTELEQCAQIIRASRGENT